MDKMREEFEKWAKERDYPLDTDAVGWYVDDQTDYTWSGWQAAWAAREEDIAELRSLLGDFQAEMEKCWDIAQRLDSQDPEKAGAFMGNPSDRIKRQLGWKQ